MVNKKHIEKVTQIKSISPRVAYIVLKLNSTYRLKLIQVYAPTTTHSNDKMEEFYDHIKRALQEAPSYLAWSPDG